MARKATALGLDIGTHAVKGLIVEMGRDGRFRANASASAEVYPPGVEPDTDGPPRRYVVKALTDVLSELGVRGKVRRLMTSVGGTRVSVKQIKSIPLPEDELESSLSFEARKHLPLDESDAIVGFQVLRGDLETPHMDILLVATTKAAFDMHVGLLSEAGLDAGVVEAETLALMNGYTLSGGSLPDDGTPVFLDLGARTTSVVVPGYGTESLFFSREIGIGGNNLTADIRKRHDCDNREAEQRKHDAGLSALSDKDDGRDKNAIAISVTERSSTEDLIEEIRRSLRYYVKESGAGAFTELLLTGGGARTEGMADALGEAIGLDVRVYEPFEEMELGPGVFPDPSFAVAAGLAMRGASDG
jgi:type IV pilus assembly protein PilM